ncbi:DUF2955 domain-containing protein [Vibrio astriarenae]|uniref:DUF2955 domain-containing protein n=1 Tax=Vibrio astriarenae TaxID=1481923 RepID=UPI00373593B2
MFHSAANPVIRLVFIPLALLFYLISTGASLAVLSPIFVVMFMTIMPSRPPLSVLMKVMAAMLVISFGMVLFGSVLVDSPTGFWLYSWLLMYWGYSRSHRDPKDIIATLTLVVVVVMVVFNKQMNIQLGILPLMLFEKLVVAIVVTYLGFWVFPGEDKDILPEQGTSAADDTPMDSVVVVLKATALTIVLAVLIGMDASQTMLITITISNMIKSGNSHDHRTFSMNKLVTTTVGILFTLPIVLLVMAGAPDFVLFGVAVVCGLQLACFAIRRQTTLSIYQLLFTNFVALAYQILNHPGYDSLTAQLMRLLSITCAIVIGALILSLIQSEKLVTAKQS